MWCTSNIIVGLITSCISGYVVNIIWKRKMDRLDDRERETQYKLDFSDDIQGLCRYLGKIQLELGFEDSPEKNQIVLRRLEESSGLKHFSQKLTYNGVSVLKQIDSVKQNIKKDAENNILSMSKCTEYKGQLLKLVIELLSHKTSFMKSWEEYKNSK